MTALKSLADTPFVQRIRAVPALQIVLVLALWLAGEAIVRLLALPVPGGIVGLALLLLLLASHLLPVARVRRGAQWLLADMLLFFVPAVLAVLDHRELFGLTGLKVLVIILASTAFVMAVTGFVVDRCLAWSLRHDPASDPR